VIVPDVNLLLYATDTLSPHHDRARSWWAQALRGPEPVGLPWSTVLAFLRLTTNPRIYREPMSSREAVDVVTVWRSRSHVVPIEPTQRHLDVLAGLLDGVGTAGNLVTDAHLAALAVEYGATLCSADADFSRFPGLSWHNPLA
jgi:uncharacterized protein